MCKKNILFICGSKFQVSTMYEISKKLKTYNCFFSAYYAEGWLDTLARNGLLEHTALSKKRRSTVEKLLISKNLHIDYRGLNHEYDLVLLAQQALIPNSIRHKKIVVIQDSLELFRSWQKLLLKLLKKLNFSIFLPTSLGADYQKICVASNGFKKKLEENGIKSSKIIVTGLPQNNVMKKPEVSDSKKYLLVIPKLYNTILNITNQSDLIQNALKIAKGRALVFGIQEPDNQTNVIKNIKKLAPQSIINQSGNIQQLIANCDLLISNDEQSILFALALHKNIKSQFSQNQLKQLLPLKNNNVAAENIAACCKKLLESQLSKHTNKQSRNISLSQVN